MLYDSWKESGRAGRKHILRAFYVEGFINHYVGNLSEDGKTLTFETESAENAPPGTRAKIVYRILADDEIEQRFYVAWPGKKYGCLSINRLKKR